MGLQGCHQPSGRCRMVIPFLDAVLGVEVGREEARRMDHVQQSICLGNSLLDRHQNPREKCLRFDFRDWKDTRMAGRD